MRSSHLSVWLYSLLPLESSLPAEITACLSRTGLSVHMTRDFQNESGPGILLAAGLDPAILLKIHAASHAGDRRVLVLCAEPVLNSNGGAWAALQQGASDVLFWQEDTSEEIQTRFERWAVVDQLANSPEVSRKMVGESRAWKSTLHQIVEAACFTQEPVLLTGETGTGKELAANLIHSLDVKRSRYDFIILDCTTIVPDLSGSELFGHERGAFTGALSARDGAFALADRGVLFLDEIGELPPGLQIQLLRVLQEHTYKRVGSNVWHKTDFRLVCATNRNLLHEVEQGRFRRDLYYRLASWKIHLPSLRERREDILPLASYYFTEDRSGGTDYSLDEQVKEYFLSRDYPGNVRDLKNLTLRIKARSAGRGRITLGDIPVDDRPQNIPPPVSIELAVVPELPPTICADSGCGEVSHAPQQDLAAHHERLSAYIRHALADGLGWDEIQRTLQVIAVQAVLEITHGDFNTAAQRIGRGERTLREWLSENRRSGSSNLGLE